jgi:hypothetical protein
MAYRTLGELRSILLARLGMGAMGASGGANQALVDSFLSNGQTQLYWAQNWKHLTAYEDKQLGVGQNQIDYPTACARDRRLLRISTVYSGQWRDMVEGIETEMWSTMDTQSYPLRFERYAQVLVYPKADQLYTLRFWFVADLAPFTEQNDRASLDDEMVLLHALANAKAHYRQQGQLSTLLASLRGQAFDLQGVYRRGDTSAPERKPAVFGRDA